MLVRDHNLPSRYGGLEVCVLGVQGWYGKVVIPYHRATLAKIVLGLGLALHF